MLNPDQTPSRSELDLSPVLEVGKGRGRRLHSQFKALVDRRCYWRAHGMPKDHSQIDGDLGGTFEEVKELEAEYAAKCWSEAKGARG